MKLLFANQVKYWRKYDDPEPGANRIFVPATANQTRLENMLPDSHYLIEVRAFNGAGLGPPGEHCEMFTKRPRKTEMNPGKWDALSKSTQRLIWFISTAPADPPRMWRYISWTGKWLYVWWDHIQYDWFGNVSFPLYYKVGKTKVRHVSQVCRILKLSSCLSGDVHKDGLHQRDGLHHRLALHGLPHAAARRLWADGPGPLRRRRRPSPQDQDSG